MSRIKQLPGQTAPAPLPRAAGQAEVAAHAPANPVGRQHMGRGLTALSPAPHRAGSAGSHANETRPAGRREFAAASAATTLPLEAQQPAAHLAPMTPSGGLGTARKFLAATTQRARAVAQAMNPLQASGRLNVNEQRQLLFLLQGPLAHTLFGNKPASITDTSEDAHFLVDLTSRRKLSANFAVVMVPQASGGRHADTVIVLNKNSVRKTMDQNPEVFGLPPAPSAQDIERKLAVLCTPEGAREAMSRANDATLGALLGFGASNAKQFAAKHGQPWVDDRHSSVHSTSDNLAALHGEMDGLVKPFGVKLWNSDETVLIANDNVNTALDVNERIDTRHAHALQTNNKASKQSALVSMALDTLFDRPPAIRPDLA